MKKFLFSATIGALMSSSVAFGQASQQEIEQFMTMYMDQYSNTMSAKFIDYRCRHLEQDEYDRLVNNLAASKRWLETFTDEEFLNTIEKGARQIAMDRTKIPCGPIAQDLATKALEISRNLALIADDAMTTAAPTTVQPDPIAPPSSDAATDLSPEEQAKAKAATDALVERYTASILGWHVEQKCKHLGDSLDAEFNTNKFQIENYVSQLFVRDAFEDLNRNIEAEANGPAIPACGRDTFDMVENSFRVSRQLLAYLKQITW